MIFNHYIYSIQINDGVGLRKIRTFFFLTKAQEQKYTVNIFEDSKLSASCSPSLIEKSPILVDLLHPTVLHGHGFTGFEIA